MIVTLPELLATLRMEVGLAKGFRIKSVILLFRLASYCHHGKSPMRVLFRPIAILYKLYTEFLLGMELPANTVIGSGLCLFHGVGLVVHGKARFGSGCVLRQGVTVGNKGGNGEDADLVPVIGNNVEFGAGAIVIGNVNIGDNVVIGAGVVITKDVPANSVVVGAAPRILVKKK